VYEASFAAAEVGRYGKVLPEYIKWLFNKGDAPKMVKGVNKFMDIKPSFLMFDVR
jgi:hypothetical protein